METTRAHPNAKPAGPIVETIVTGTVATASVAAAMSVARRARLTDARFAHLLGTLAGPPALGTKALGWVLFVGNGILLAGAYRVALGMLPRTDPRASGAALGVLHGLVAASGAALLAHKHPRPRAGGLHVGATRRRPRASTLAVIGAVHVVFGAVIGALATRGGGRAGAVRA